MKVIFRTQKYLKDCEVRKVSETKELMEDDFVWFNRLDGRIVEMLDTRKGIIKDTGFEYSVNIDWCEIEE